MGSEESVPAPSQCEIQYWDYPYGYGRHQTWGLPGNDKRKQLWNLGDYGWNDDIQSLELRGPSHCWARACEHSNFRGRCVYFYHPHAKTFPWGSQLSNTLTSIEFGEGSVRPWRRLEGDAEADAEGELRETMSVMKPSTADVLCTAVYEEFFATDGHMVTNSTIKEYEVTKLGDRCTEAYGEGEAADFCKFNVAAGAEIFNDFELEELLSIEREDENEHTELDHCEFLEELILEGVKGGEIEGISIDTTDEGDFYMLDAEGMTAGALIAAFIGKTMIKILSSTMRS